MTLLDDYRRAVYSGNNGGVHHRLTPLPVTTNAHGPDRDGTKHMPSKRRTKPSRVIRLEALAPQEAKQAVRKTPPVQSNQREHSAPTIFDRLAVLSAEAERESSSHAFCTPTELPAEFIYHGGAHLHLNRWSVLVSDKTLQRIAAHNRRLHATLQQRLATPSTSKTSTFSCTTKSIHINGADKITDIGLRTIAESVPTLESLEIAHAPLISDAGLRLLAAHCPRLARLNLSNCPSVRGAGLAAVAEHCPSISDLLLADCPQLSDWVLRRCFYAFASTLRHVDLSRCPQLTDNLVVALASQCPQLESLEVADCVGVTDVGVVALAQKCRRLAKLVLRRSVGADKLTDTSCAALGEHCPALRELDVAGCSFLTDAGIQWLAQGCSSLSTLDVSGVIYLTDAAMRALGMGCAQLQSLKLNGVKSVSDVGLRFLATGCPSLASLHLTSLYLVSDGRDRDFGLEGLAAVAQSCAQLCDLNLTGCFQVVERSLVALSRRCAQLTRLSLKGCPQVTLLAVTALLKGCSLLSTLDLSGVLQCSNAMLAAIALHGHHLQDLRLAGCEKVGDAGLVQLASKRANQLVSLDLTGCALVSDSGVGALVDGFRSGSGSGGGAGPKLQHLRLSDCPLVTQDAVTRLAFACPLLLTLSLRGCRVSPRVLQSLSACWPLATLRTASSSSSSSSFYGMWPVARAKDKRFIEESCVLWAAAVKVQSLFRRRVAARDAQRQREHQQRVWVARKLQSVWRGRRARREAMVLMLFQSARHKAATLIQRRYRALRVSRRAASQLQTLHDAQLDKYVVLVQRRYRAVRAARLARAIVLATRRQRQRETDAAVLVQRRYRGVAARRRVTLLQLHRLAHEQEQLEASRRIQAVYRGRMDRKKAREAEREKQQQLALRHACARRLQALWRRWLARKAAERRREARAYRERCAVRLQTAFRARRDRATTDLLRLAKRHAEMHAAATLLQRHWRGRCDRVAFAVLKEAKRLREERREAAAVLLQRSYRRYLIRCRARAVLMELLRAKRHDEEMERWAATLVQAKWRRRGAMKELLRVQQEKRSRWKQLVDTYNQHGMGFGAPFFYNQVNGEIRWRMPREILTLQPRPACDQCELPSSASVECATCGEFFCSDCHAVVHGGGRRKAHATRRLFNFYGFRCDYGDGAFPSVWPAEKQQDRERGYDFVAMAPKPNYLEMLWQLAQFQPVETDPANGKKVDDTAEGSGAEKEEELGEPGGGVEEPRTAASAVLFLEDDVDEHGESLWASFFDYGANEYRYYHRLSKRVTSQPPLGVYQSTSE